MQIQRMFLWLSCVFFGLLEFTVVATDQSAKSTSEFRRNGSSTFGCGDGVCLLARSDGECSVLCGEEQRCVAYVFRKADRICQQCFTTERSTASKTDVTWKVLKDCGDPGTNYTGYLMAQPAESSQTFLVECQGGWTIIQRRTNGSLDFNRTWIEYKKGFGSLGEEMWLGNDNIYSLTLQGNYTLQYEMTDWNCSTVVREHSGFSLSNETDFFRLSIGHNYNDGDKSTMNTLDGLQFSTRDSDHDTASNKNCGMEMGGGWWFRACGKVLLTARYPQEGGVCYGTVSHCMRYKKGEPEKTVLLKRSLMKIKREDGRI